MTAPLSPDQRAAFRQVGRDAAADKDHLSEFDRSIIGYGKVRIDLPLRDTQMMKKHLELLAAAVDRCRVILSYSQKDERGTILAVRGILREVNQKVNAYRNVRSY